MFHQFRSHQKRKVNSHSSGGHKEQNEKGVTIPTLPLKLFMQQDEKKESQQRPTLLNDDSSADLSVYTTETKTTVQYPPRDPYGRMNSAEWPSKRDSANAARATTVVAQKSNLLGAGSATKEVGNRSQSPKTVTGTRLNECMVINTSRPSSPSTAPSTPPRDLDHPEDEDVEDYYDYDHRIHERRQASLASGSVSRTSSNPTAQESIASNNRVKHWRGPVDLDDSSIEDYDNDEDDDVVREAEEENVQHASVFRKKITSSTILPEDSDNEALVSPMVWTDYDDDDDGITELVPPPRKLSDEDGAALNRSYHQTMQSISFHSIDESGEDNGYGSDDMDSGAVLLTQEELQKHVNKVQNKEPMPSSYIGGYDQWKQEQEYKRRYFERLQRKVNEKKRHQQPHAHPQLDQSPRRPAQSATDYNRSSGDSLADFTRYTYENMDKSVASTIATARTKESSSEKSSGTATKSKTKGVWKILPKLTGSSKKKTPSKMTGKVQSRHASPPREAVLNQVEELSEVANMSLAPLNSMLGMNVGSEGEPRELVSQYLQVERKKQLQAEEDKAQEEWKEQERIQRKKEEYLRRQRELNNIVTSGPRCTSPGPISPVASRDFKEEGTAPLCSASFESERSGARSATILSPCILCDEAERTHIAMPCMHFFFCGSCVEKMTQNCSCPVCGASSVNFARVYTG